MQNRYFGDVGDFGKYGLLRILGGGKGEFGLRLGIVWYLYPDEGHNQDGKYISYLQKDKDAFRLCDIQLYDGLRSLLFDDLGLIESSRHTGAIEKSGLLPDDTLFYGEPLTYAAGLALEERESFRKNWFANALAKTASADLVFLDPDNGIECVSVKRTATKGPKYVFWDEMEAFIDRGQSIVVYHHLNRSCPHPQQVQEMLKQMRSRFAKDVEISATTFTRGSSRTYFIATSPRHKDFVRERLAKVASGPWSGHFK